MRRKVYPDRDGTFIKEKETLDHTTTELRMKYFLPRFHKAQPLNLRLFYSSPLFGPNEQFQ
jgi:hypothetical protein